MSHAGYSYDSSKCLGVVEECIESFNEGIN